jgi:hypothetical protein
MQLFALYSLLFVSRGWILPRIDVGSTFIHGFLYQDVYMQ